MPPSSRRQLQRAEAIIAASLGARDVRLVVDPSGRDHVTLSITRRDPFELTALPFPLIADPHFDAWQPIPVGVDEEGEIVMLSLPEHNVLFGAEPGGGKSVPSLNTRGCFRPRPDRHPVALRQAGGVGPMARLCQAIRAPPDEGEVMERTRSGTVPAQEGWTSDLGRRLG